MAEPLKRVAWDACTWIALIQNEKIIVSGKGLEDRGGMCRMVIEAAKKGSVEIVTSTLCLAEVCKHPDKKATSDKLADYFENDYVALVSVDTAVGERARQLMIAGYSGLKPPDAVHIATAAITGVEQMHTFDDRLLKLNGLIDKADGTKLRICKPDAIAAPAPLLEGVHAKEEKKQAPQPGV